MSGIQFIVLILFVFGCNHDRTTESAPMKGEKRLEVKANNSKNPNMAQEKLIKQAVSFANENGRSTDGFLVSVSEWSKSWNIWFTPRNTRDGTGSGFVVEIFKDGVTPPRIQNGQ